MIWVRQFDTGATRDTDEGKPDYEGFLSPLVLARYARYMNKNRVQADGKLRDSDNWQKGIPLEAYMKSGWRHFFEWWRLHRESIDDTTGIEHIEEAMCALLFNVMGYLHELEKRRGESFLVNVSVEGGAIWVPANPLGPPKKGERG